MAKTQLEKTIYLTYYFCSHDISKKPATLIIKGKNRNMFYCFFDG